MKRHFRLRSSLEINRVRQSGKAFSSSLVVLIMLENQSVKTKLAVVATRSVGGAIERNRSKRILRAVASEILPTIKQGYDLVLIGRKSINNASFSEVRTAVNKVINDANIKKNDQNAG